MKSEMHWIFSHLLLLHLLLTCFLSTFCYCIDTITSTEFIKDPSTISSNGSYFELGFFRPANSSSRYVGIWFKQVSPQTVVWVANRDKPLNDTSGVLTISSDGNLVVLDGRNTILWSSNISKPAANTSARISDSGNLILEDSASGAIIWESFRNPSDKFLPMMKLITNLETKERLEFTSWRSPSDPAPVNFSFAMDVRNIPEIFIWNGRNRHWRSGPYDGQSFIGVPNRNQVYLHGFDLVVENQTYYLSIGNTNGAQRFYYKINSQGNLEETYWDFAAGEWKVSWSALTTRCDFYGTCGAFGICNAQASPICSCLRGFKPKREEEWNRGNWSDGCVRNMPLHCEKLNNGSTEQGKEDGFLKLEMAKLPDYIEWFNLSASADDCRLACLNNCSCTAYAYEIGIRCMLWTANLTDIQRFNTNGAGAGADLYLRLAHTELDDVKDKKNIIIASVITGALFLIFVTYFFWRWMTAKNGKRRRQTMLLSNLKGMFFNMKEDKFNQIKLQELPLYEFEKLAIATNNFELSNKLGEGGFGPVYRGILPDGQEIAVKRLSRASHQGLEEFTNEVMVISKLQHRNLVRLLGCCVEGEEKMLIYEYLPNLSLDAQIFESHPPKQLLDWKRRFNIIDGIARGLLYLHRDSRWKIIHRDLKASNILLDKDLNPKISDFGMARIFGSNVAQANTLRVVGTYGYMSPEYAMQGQFSEKSDVFSFGVLLLEIISGRRNTDFYHHEQAISLLGFAWKLWMEENIVSLIDSTIYEECHQSEILRCIQVGLLCVQEFAKDRPNISTIISMLNSEIIDLPHPKQPGYTGRQIERNSESSQQSSDKYSVNTVTITTIVGL